MDSGFIVMVGGVGLLILAMILFMYFPVNLWITAITSGIPLSPVRLITMRLRGVDQYEVILPLIQGKKAGLKLSLDQLEAHYMANGHVGLVVNALISAAKAGIPLSFNEAAAIDLAGRNVLQAVQMSVNPKVITTPKITAMAKDGIQITAKARVTVKAKIDKLVGGAGEDTILARVGEGICTTIGSAESHKDILENPDKISSTIMQKGLDQNTAFEIISIDVEDVDVGKNIGAQLLIDQAEADKKVAQAEAEKRRAMAVAKYQENVALEQEMKAKLVEAEAQIPLALAEALRNGNIGVMDFYRLKNVEADTEMRNRFASLASSSPMKSGMPGGKK